MKHIYLTAFLLLSTLSGFTQAPIDHWETVIHSNDIWRYREGTSEPLPTWRTIGFADGAWLTGRGGFGYGDGDDSTVIGSVNSLYLRKTFTITDTADIALAVLHIDYDDGFIAYLNDVEIARANLGTAIGDHPLYSAFANSSHEALVYPGGIADNYYLDKNQIKAILKNGANVLAIQVHNVSSASSDMTCIADFSVGLTTTATPYTPVPAWFYAPPLSSNLPLVHINTGVGIIVDDPKIPGTIGITDNGPGLRNGITDAFNDHFGNISIEIRGSSSQMFPKKSYGFETQDSLGLNDNVSLLGLPKENDWILYAPYTDKTCMRDAMNFMQFRRMQHYTTPTLYCELFVNHEYMGIYILEEKIKIDDGRLDLPPLDADDNAGDSLTGGYIFKADKTTGSGSVAWTSIEDASVQFIFHDPDDATITPAQSAYIIDYVTDFETAMLGPGFADPDTGYRKYIDPGSFTDYLLAQELAHNVDGYRLSSFFHKNRDSNGGQFRAGPAWDCNLCFGNADYCDGWRTDSWAYEFDTVCSWASQHVPFWWGKLMTDPRFAEETRCRWDFLRGNLLHTDTIYAWIDSVAALLSESQVRNFERWPILGTYVWPNSYIGATFDDEVNFLKTWTLSRIAWMDGNLPSPPPVCTSTGFDSIFVSEINYHPEAGWNTLDWFELYNASADTIDLSGWRVKDENPANIFTFRPGTFILPDSFLVVCQDTTAFDALHDTVYNRVGQFHWNLENSSDMLHLFDAGYTEAIVLRYHDSLPWPDSTDGLGYTLQVIDPFGDPNDPANWMSSCQLHGTPGMDYYPCVIPVSTAAPFEQQNLMIVFPNPFSGSTHVRVRNGGDGYTFHLCDLTGRMLMEQVPQGEVTTLDCSSIPAGIYFLQLRKGDVVMDVKKVVVE